MREVQVQCDRCGHQIPINALQTPTITFRGVFPIRLDLRVEDVDATTYEDIDLCEKCISELREWWLRGLVREAQI